MLSDEKFSVLKIKVLTDGGRHIFTNWANLNWDMRPPAFRIRLLSLKLLNVNRFLMKHKYNTQYYYLKPNLENYLGKGIVSQKVMSEAKIHVCVLLSLSDDDDDDDDDHDSGGDYDDDVDEDDESGCQGSL